MKWFWAGKAKVPKMEEYNDAISDSLAVIRLLDLLALGWAAMTVLKLLGL